MTTILDGKALAKKLTDKLKLEIKELDIKPNLAVILIGENPASLVYVKNKQKKAAELSINTTLIQYPQDVEEAVVLAKIDELNKDKSINAILVQLPISKHLNTDKILNSITPIKDVDGFTTENLGKLLQGSTPFAYPCTPKGVLTLLKEYSIKIEGAHAVIVGRSNIVGKPLMQMLLNENATVTVCHSRTENLKEITKTADILISATGNKIITADMVKKDSTIIDVGIFKDNNNKLTGDVDFENIKDKVKFITPVPGGVGPMTIASLMLNTFVLYKLQNK